MIAIDNAIKCLERNLSSKLHCFCHYLTLNNPLPPVASDSPSLQCKSQSGADHYSAGVRGSILGGVSRSFSQMQFATQKIEKKYCKLNKKLSGKFSINFILSYFYTFASYRIFNSSRYICSPYIFPSSTEDEN